jgi:hypothetical protein
VIGAAFSAAIRLAYRGRRVPDIDPARFALLGAAVGGLGVPLYLQLMHVLSGSGMLAWNLVSTDAVIGAVFGGVVAGGSIWLARKARPLGPDPTFDPVTERPAIGDGITVGDLPDRSIREGALREPGRLAEPR